MVYGLTLITLGVILSNFLSFAVIALTLSSIPAVASAQRANPTEAQNAIGRDNPCADPWVSYAVSEVKTRGAAIGRAAGSGNSHECNTMLYNGGSWGSFDELLGHVRRTQSALASQNARFDMVNGAPAFVVTRPLPANLIGQDGAGIISNDGASFISNNGVTIVSSGYRLQSNDGARLNFRLPNGQNLRIR